ncbi:hypothetical protein GBA52_008268 [Prunus armeniaca]|nr:hypothetical protein GBA52_008268 [Prunus armeniaca]
MVAQNKQNKPIFSDIPLPSQPLCSCSSPSSASSCSSTKTHRLSRLLIAPPDWPEISQPHLGFRRRPSPHTQICCMPLETKNLKKSYCPPRETNVEVTHSMPPEQIEIFTSLDDWAENNILVHLKPVEK